MRNNGLSVSACMNMLGLYTWGLLFEEGGGGGGGGEVVIIF
jgi:hypothetical protein